MKSVILLLAALLPLSGRAEALKLEELSLQYRRLLPGNRVLLIAPEAGKEHLSLGLKTDAFKVLFADFNVAAYTSQSQYRSIGLQMDLGLRLTPSLEVGYYHQSQHVLDRLNALIDGFPVEDAIAVKLFLYRAGQSRPALF